VAKLTGFDAIFKPRSIAVVGASNTPGSVGKAVMDNLLWGGFAGTIYPINVKPVSFPGLQSYPSITALHEPVDLAMVIVPAAIVPKVMKQIADAGIKAAIIISAGFAESGPEGQKLEQEVAKICFDHGITLLGPNCLGVLNPHHKLNASFAGALATPGAIAFVSQSGALCTAILDLASVQGLGFSKFVSIGNKAGMHDVDLLEYLAEDPETKVIMMYMEALKPHPNWVATVQRITHHPVHPKPIIVLKAGKSVGGAEASHSHTGSLAGDDVAYQAFFAQAGITRAETIEELFDLATVFLDAAIPTKPGVAIVTNAGGPGIIATDAAELHHLTLAHLMPTTEKSLHKVLPPAANIHNPIDLIGDADSERYHDALSIVGKDKNVGSLLIILTPQAMTDAIKSAQAIGEIRKKFSHLTLVTSFMGAEAVRSGRELLRRSGIATVQFPDSGAKALAALIKYGQFLHAPLPKFHATSGNKKGGEAVIATALKKKQTQLLPHEADEVLKQYGFPLAQSAIAKTAVEAVKMAHDIGKPVALKVVSPDIVHKTDVGGVRLHLTEPEVAEAYEGLLKDVRKHAPGSKIEGVLVQETAAAGQEIIVGAKRDPVFGPLLMVGIGGIFVEVWKDVAFRVAPLSADDANTMIEGLEAAPLLTGTRGQNPLDIESVVQCLLKLSQLMLDHPNITEIDINPLVVGDKGKGATVIDARIILNQPHN